MQTINNKTSMSGI